MFFLLKYKTDVKYTQKKRKRETNICLFIYWGALQWRKKLNMEHYNYMK